MICLAAGIVRKKEDLLRLGVISMIMARENGSMEAFQGRGAYREYRA